MQVGRSRSITGPYVDRQGTSLNVSRAGGTPVIAPNGNIWVGPGHHAIATDLAGQDWFVYHAIDRRDPYLDGTDGINERPMLLDRLDWIGGWPTVRAGRWASESAQPGPAYRGRWYSSFDGGTAPFVARGGWTRLSDQQRGGYGRSTGARGSLLTTGGTGPTVRVEADLRSAPGTRAALVAMSPDRRSSVRAVLDPGSRQLSLVVNRPATASGAATPLPPGFLPSSWHSLSLQVRGRDVRVELTHARLGDPLAVLRTRLDRPLDLGGPAGLETQGTGVDADALSVLPAAVPVTTAAPGPQVGRLDRARSDEFDGALEPGWTRVRDPQATVAGDRLVWPVEDTDLVGTRNDAGLLLRDAPDGRWTIETKLTIDLGTDDIRNFQQGGLVAYVDDDLFTRFSHVAIWNTRQTEFGKEMPYAGRLSFGGTIVGPPADTTWLRISHTVAANGEHRLRASSSRDGRTWVLGGTWTLPAGSDIKVGLVSHGRQTDAPRATSQFDYFRVYR